MDHDQVVIFRLRDRAGEVVIMGRRIEQARAWNHAGGIRQPGRIPERPDLAGGLVSGTGAAVEIVVGGRIEEESLHVIHSRSGRLSAWLVIRRRYKAKVGAATDSIGIRDKAATASSARCSGCNSSASHGASAIYLRATARKRSVVGLRVRSKRTQQP